MNFAQCHEISCFFLKASLMNNLIVIESLTIVNSLNKVQFPFVKVFPPQMLSSSSEGAIVQAVPIAFAPEDLVLIQIYTNNQDMVVLIGY